MSDRLRRRAAISLALLIVAVVAIYALGRTEKYESGATIVLAPAPEDPGNVPFLLDSFTRSGTLGTYVELLDSDDLARRAGAANVEVSVRSVPDTRAVQITATGTQGVVQAALRRLIEQASAEEDNLRDPWELQILESPSVATVAGPSRQMIILGGVLGGALAALLSWILLPRRRAQPAQEAPRGEPEPAPGTASPRLLSERRGR